MGLGKRDVKLLTNVGIQLSFVQVFDNFLDGRDSPVPRLVVVAVSAFYTPIKSGRAIICVDLPKCIAT